MNATMTDTDLRHYVEQAEQDKASWLGVMVVYSVESTRVRHDELSRKMADHHLEGYMVPEPTDENVWRRIFTDGVRKTIPEPTDAEPKAERRLRMTQVSRDGDVYTKRLVVEHVKPSSKQLDWEEVVDVRFDTGQPDTVDIKNIGNWDDDAWNLVNGLRDEYSLWRGCIDGQGVRVVVRSVLEACRATSLRPGGGVYFVNMMYEQKVEALEAVAEIIPGTLVHTLPIIDTGKQRANLKKAFEYESNKEINDLIVEMRDTVDKGGTVSKQTLAKFDKASRKARAKLAEYQQLLNENLDVVDAKLQIAEQLQIQLLLGPAPAVDEPQP